ncbi:MAG: glutamine synthetase [Chloroflexia bacterium]|nr:glutamine synthetase [Chloroflexia bacterium]
MDRTAEVRERDVDRVLKSAHAMDLRLVRFLYVDFGGIVRGKATHAAGLADRVDEGIALTTAQMASNALDDLLDIPGMTAVGEVRLVPDPTSFTVLPYAPRTGQMTCDLMTLDRQPWAFCPRAVLRRAIAAAADEGLDVQAVFENEFYLLREEGGGLVAADDSPCFSTRGMDAHAPFTDDLIAALEAQGIQVEQAVAEHGGGQQELSIRHAPALAAADHQVVFRETAREVARQHGLRASFAAKPFADQVGSGAHVHLSLWDVGSGENVFYDPGAERGFSELGRQFVAGVLDHLPGLVALTCPTVNSYERLLPRAWASAYTTWGFDNREAAVRVPSTFWGREQGTTNVELKAVDPTANPYLALAGIIAAGLDGVRRDLSPGDPAGVDPATMTPEARADAGMRRLPETLDAALTALAADQVLVGALGADCHRGYEAVRRSEADAYRDMELERIFAEHRRRY